MHHAWWCPRSCEQLPVTSSQNKQFPCRVEGCGQLYTYLKARDNHERKKHNIEISSQKLPEENTPSNRDHKKEHTLARLSFGFFILNMMDAVKEGDGERLMRLYKVALLFYKAMGTATMPTALFYSHCRWMPLWALAWLTVLRGIGFGTAREGRGETSP